MSARIAGLLAPPLPPCPLFLRSHARRPPFFRPCPRPTRALYLHASPGAFLRDAGATVLVTAGAYSLVRSFDFLASRNLIEQNLSRKVVHVLSGLLFMASWPIFSDSMEARYFAALVPFLNAVRLLVYGLSLAKDEGLVKSVTRQGKPEELLKGPLYYVLVLMFCTLVFWRDSPVGVISLSMLSGGDGFADIMGRHFGSVKLPYNQGKSWAGSLGMFLFGFSISIGMLYYFSELGLLRVEWVGATEKVAIVALAATLVESFPITEETVYKILTRVYKIPVIYTDAMALGNYHGEDDWQC